MANQTDTYDATATITVPAGVAYYEVACTGGGAGGSYTGSKAARPGGGGGGGGYAQTLKVDVIPGKSYTVTVGAEVAAQKAGNPSKFVGEGGTICNANGGGTSNTYAGGKAGAGVSGNTLKSGGAGGNASNTNNYGGAGGGEGGSLGANGVAGKANTTSTGGAGGTGGDGGDGGKGGNNGAAGSDGIAPGGGGGGAGGSSNTAGKGAAGRVTLTYVIPECVPQNVICV